MVNLKRSREADQQHRALKVIAYHLPRIVVKALSRRIRVFRIIFACCLLFPVVSYAELQFSDAWIRDMPPIVPVRAGYLTIHNPGSSSLKIVAIKSEAFANVEIHQTIEQDGTVRMERVPELRIAANSSVQLAPGGLHLMLMQPVEPVKAGVKIRITLIFEDGGEQDLNLVVK